MTTTTIIRTKIAPIASALLVASAAAGCDDPGATLAITDARASRDQAHHVVVDVDLQAYEIGGKNIGTYCVRVMFTGEDVFQQDCRADLQDGDTRTARFVSTTDLAGGAAINVRVRLATADDRRDLVSPP